MLKNFVVETVNAPGTTAIVNLLGALTGRMTWKGAGHASGAQAFYFMEDGSIYECGIGVLTHGSPDTFNRQTVLANSSGTTSRLNFAGTTRIYNEIPAERAIWKTSTGTLDMESRLISATWWAGNSTGSGSAYVVAFPKAVSAYAGGLEFKFRAHANCAANATLNAGQGAKAIYRPTSSGILPVQASEILTGQIVTVTYDPSTDTFMLSHLPGGAVGARIGDYVFGAWSALPPGCLWPDGRNVSRTTYAALFAAISTTYGAGDGSTTFGLPDVRGRALFGKDNLGGTTASRITNAVAGIVGTTLGAAGGSQSLHAHVHGINDSGHGHSVSDPGHVHGFLDRINAGGLEGNVNGPNSGGSDLNRNTDGAVTGISIVASGTGISIQSTGAGGSQNMPPAIISNIAIYAGVA